MRPKQPQAEIARQILDRGLDGGGRLELELCPRWLQLCLRPQLCLRLLGPLTQRLRQGDSGIGGHGPHSRDVLLIHHTLQTPCSAVLPVMPLLRASFR
jgi:hypothetical protein